MITVKGEHPGCRDEVSRRNFIKAGFLGLGALTLPDILRVRAEAAAAGENVKRTSVIYLELAGGPTHFETYDPKPDAPAEYRGPFSAIPTNVSGIQLSELMVEQAKIMDKLAVIRSIHHDSSSHDTSSHLTQTGYYKGGLGVGTNAMPSVGSYTAKFRGSNVSGVPAYVAVPGRMRNGRAAWLGAGYNPFECGSDPNRRNFKVQNLAPANGLTLDRLDDRRSLLRSFDEMRRLGDRRNAESIDQFMDQAFDMVTGDRARAAFDIGKENAKVRDRYGRNSVGQSMLLARRLVEAGSTFVTVRVGGWDDHNKIADRMKRKGPDYDRGVAALVSDLHARGMNEDVLVVAMGEFGRTPRVNKNAGRDHWGRVMSVLMAGGGFRMGQAIGASNRKGEVPVEAPYRPEHVLATMYRHLGIDPALTIDDTSGRPRYLLEDRKVIRELL